MRSVTQVPLGVDVNQGWKDRNEALDMIHWLHEQGVIYIEQPLPKPPWMILPGSPVKVPFR